MSLPNPRSGRIIVTGGSGFIGTNVVQAYLDAQPAEFVSVDVTEPKRADHRTVWRALDIRNEADMRRLFAEIRPTHLLHLGARTDMRGATLDDYSANTVGVESMLAAVRSCDSLEAVVFASSRMVCRIGYQPTSDTDYCAPNSYGESKVVGERLVRAADLSQRWTIVRPTSIWGPYFGIPYRDFFESVLRGRYIHPRGRAIRKSFGYVGNSVHQLLTLLHEPATDVDRRTFYLADDPPLEVFEFAQEIAREANRRPIRSVPYPLLRAIAKTGDLLERTHAMHDAPLTSFRLDNLCTQMVHDLSGINAATGPAPFDRLTGIRATLDYMASAGATFAADQPVR